LVWLTRERRTDESESVKKRKVGGRELARWVLEGEDWRGRCETGSERWFGG